MATTHPTVEVGSFNGKCGFCAFGDSHDRCTTATTNGAGTKVYRCTCGCPRSQMIRCFTCDHREPVEAGNINPETWRCIDPDECSARIERRLAANPIIRQIREIKEGVAERTRTDRAAAAEAAGLPAPRPRAAGPSRPTSGACLHCGEPTKGGKFLPGHDASYIAQAVTAIREGSVTLEATIESWELLGISEALRAKLAKRAVS